MSELPAPKARTEKLIAVAEEVASRPLPLQARILLPVLLLIIGIGAFWFGLRDDDGGETPNTVPPQATIAPGDVSTPPPSVGGP